MIPQAAGRFHCSTARKHRHEFTKKIEGSIHDAILEAAQQKLMEHVKAGRLAKGFGVEMS
jgi:hypothetical protein